MNLHFHSSQYLVPVFVVLFASSPTGATTYDKDGIQVIDPLEQGFFAKVLEYEGIPIKAPAVVDNKALLIARDRLRRQLKNLPEVRFNLKVAGAELHIIGKDQVTSDLPEHHHL